jgi:hypothetical protein
MHARLLLPLSVLALVDLTGCGDNQTPPTRNTYVGADAGALACVPNLDGKIDGKELTPALDVPVNYLINPAGKDRPVDVVGALSGGKRTWKFDVDYADDQKLTLKASAVSGKWYAASFPTGGFVSAVDAAGTLEGVYRHDDSGILLLGIASRDEAPKEGKTLYVYQTPIAVFRFPLVAGSNWVSAGTVVNGTIRGLPYAGKDTYEVSDDATGKLVLHDYTFEQAHRIRTKVTLSPSAGATLTRFQVGYFVECFGEVARAVSKDNEPNADFTAAAELRRLGQ